MNNLEQKIYDASLPIVTENNLTLFSVEEVTEAGLKIIRVLVDSDHVIDVDEVTKVIEPLQAIVEKEDLIPDEYYLEVSSVGLERPLRNIDELTKAINEYIYLDLTSPVDKEISYYGTLIDIKDEKLSLKVNKKGRIKTIIIPYELVKFARIAVKF